MSATRHESGQDREYRITRIVMRGGVLLPKYIMAYFGGGSDSTGERHAAGVRKKCQEGRDLGTHTVPVPMVRRLVDVYTLHRPEACVGSRAERGGDRAHGGDEDEQGGVRGRGTSDAGRGVEGAQRGEGEGVSAGRVERGGEIESEVGEVGEACDEGEGGGLAVAGDLDERYRDEIGGGSGGHEWQGFVPDGDVTGQWRRAKSVQSIPGVTRSVAECKKVRRDRAEDDKVGSGISCEKEALNHAG
ncbi:hypothetical protein DFH08DRAFT_1033731 [Mycena albidolilacea]|uniref:Uncharacterized protein n=1 Tax=Mycena albidolilacea TaxID=1033008 RepID=A0AAD7EFY5_9AGAR|nr:hypothetical protein DFH08DRAFT_1033731 [Mycena albidolilacea]